jgi:hypothetical protein
MSALVSTVSKVLKDKYLGPVNGQLNSDVLVFQLLDLDTANIDLDGLRAVVPLHKGRTAGIGARLENETLPTAGNQAYDAVYFDLTYQYGRAQFSGQSIQKTKTDAGAFIRVMTDELDRLRDDLGLDLARQVYSDGTARIASINDSTTSATHTISSAEAIDKGYLYPGMRVDIGTLAAPTSLVTNDPIVSVSGTTVVATTSITTTGAQFYFRTGNANASSVSKEVQGLQAFNAAAAGVYPANLGQATGIDSSTAANAYWDNLRTNVAGAVSLSQMMIDTNRANAKGAKASDLITITTPGIARRLFETSDFKSNVRFVDDTAGDMSLKSGFEKLSFSAGAGTYSLVTDRLAPWGQIHFVDKSRLKVFSPGGWDFLARDGLTIRWVDSKDAFQAVLFRYLNIGAGRRNTSVLQFGITDTGY